MKRVFLICLALSLVFATLGCGAGEQQEVPTETTAAEAALTEQEQQILTQRREMVVEQMRDMMTVLWRSDVDVTYSRNRNSLGLEDDPAEKVMTLKAGRLYSGLPYTHGNGSIYDWQALATECDENGIYHLSGLTTDLLTGVDTLEPNRRARLGNDCADAVSWAWALISPTMNYTQTFDMTEANGCIKVGDFNCDPVKHSYTKTVCEENGLEVMCAAYAKLQPGDAVVHNNSPESHAMLVSQVHPTYDANGNLDWMNSYVNVIHQTSSNLFGEKCYFDEDLNEMVYYCGKVEEEYYFYDLYDRGYLPFTCKELIDPAPLEQECIIDSVTEYSLENITSGYLVSNYVISYVTITITDEAGNVAQEATCFVTESELKNFDVSHFAMEAEQDVLLGGLDLEALAEGSYHCTHVVKFATGNDMTVRDFEFTV